MGEDFEEASGERSGEDDNGEGLGEGERSGVVCMALSYLTCIHLLTAQEGPFINTIKQLHAILAYHTLTKQARPFEQASINEPLYDDKLTLDFRDDYTLG